MIDKGISFIGVTLFAGDEQIRVVIEQECEAYILDKAALHGITCRVKVTCKAGEEGVWLPWAVEFLEPTSESGRNILTRIAEEDLGIPPQRQSFVDEEAAA